MEQCQATGAALLPPWEPCNDHAAGGSDAIYSVISSVNVRHMNLSTDREPGQEPLEKHKRRHEDTHWQGGPGEDGPQWDSPTPLANEWHWQQPNERNPATSTYPLLCELLNFCLRSPSAQALRGSNAPNGLVEGWEAVIDQMFSRASK